MLSSNPSLSLNTTLSTFGKTNIATTRVMHDLTVKGYDILLPLQEQLPFDLVAYKDGVFLRLQVKWSSGKKGNPHSHPVQNRKYVWYRNASKVYGDNLFDYYAVYLPEVDAVIYPSFKYGGHFVRTETPNSRTPYYWYEDFLTFQTNVEKRQNGNVNWKATISNRVSRKSTLNTYDRATLETLVWSKSIDEICHELKVAPKTVKARCKTHGISLPPRLYWTLRAVGYSHEDALTHQPRVRRPAKRLSKDQIQGILSATGRSLRELGKEYNVPHTTILGIKRGDIYTDIIAEIRQESVGQ